MVELMAVPRPKNCAYVEGEGACYKTECPLACVRNYRDQGTTDLPPDMVGRKAAKSRSTRRQREPRLSRLLSLLK